MKTNLSQKFLGTILISVLLLANGSRAGSLTDYGAIPQIATPPENQLDGNQRLDFHTDLFTGRFNYRVPIQVPPARGGTEPNIVLQYSSANKNGWCGVGWDLDMGYIQRETRYGVPVSGGAYSDNYGFIFSIAGHSGRLVNVGGSTYYAQINTDFLKFVYSSGYWTVTDKDGRKYYFGETTASRISTTFGTFRWALSSTLDPDGNQSIYSYTTDNGQLYLSEIDYNGNVNSPVIATNCAVVFDLTGRTDVFEAANSGAEIKTTKLLTGIRVYSQGQLVRRYALAYIASPSTYRALLQSVTQYGADNTTALPPIAFGYSVQQAGFSNPVYWPIVSQTSLGDPYGISPATPDSQLIDVNGDGLPDRVIHPYGQSYFDVQYNQGPTFGFSSLYYWSPAVNETDDGSTPWIQLDSSGANGDGSLSSISELLDINGDGIPDRVLRQHDLNSNFKYDHLQVQLNNGTSLNSSINDWTGVNSVNGNYPNQLNTASTISSDGVSSWNTMADMNGDGLPDRVMLGSANGRFDVQLNNGSGFSSVTYWTGVAAAGTRTDSYYAPRARDNTYVYSDLIDMNGDGLPDRIFNNGSGTAGVQINNGVNGFGSVENWNMGSGANTIYPGELSTANGAYFVMLVDMNGDGLPDWVLMPYYGGGYYTVFFNTGTGFSSTGVTWNNVSTGGLGTGGDAMQAWDANGTRAEMIDMNGDGLPDRVMRYPNPGIGTDYLQVQYNLGPYPDLLVLVTNGIGGSLQTTYAPSTLYLNPDDSQPRMPFPAYAVTSVVVNDGRGNSGTNTYTYSGPYYDSTFKEFRGFYRVSATDPLGATTLTYFQQGGDGSWNGSADGQYNDDTAKAGMPFRIEHYGSDGQLYSITMNLVNEVLNYDGGNVFNRVYFPYLQQTLQLDYEATSTPRVTAVGYTYNGSTGNLLSETDYGEVTGVNLASQSFSGVTGTPPPVYRFYTYATIPSNPDIIDKPESITVSSDLAGSTVMQQTLYQYFDVTGDLKQESELVCPSTYAVTQYTDDNYGNVQTITDPASLLTTINYDSTATFPVRTYLGTLADNLIDYTQYDPRSGQLLSETNEQGLVTANLYDAFFRLTNSATSTTPDGSATLWRKRLQYNLGGIIGNNSSNWIRLLVNDPANTATGYHETYTYLDGLGRTIQTRDEAETNGYRVSDLVYDKRGSVMLVSYPFFSSGSGYTLPSGTLTNVYTQYDPIGRVAVVNPCATASFNGNGWLSGTPSISTGDNGSPVGPTSIAYKDGANVWAIVVTNPLSKVHKYYLDAFGRTNQIVEVTSQGNFTTSLGYDLLGNLTNITDNALNQTAFFYDDLGREVAMADPDMGFWQWIRDLDGRVVEQIDAKGQQIKFQYNDPAGRLTLREGWTAGGVCVSTNAWFYDSNFGDNSYVVYPGQLFEVMDDEGWQKFSYDVRNRTLKSVRYLSKNGNTYTDQFTFDDADRLTAAIYPNGGPTTTNLFDTGENLSQVRQVSGPTFYTARGFNAARQLLGVTFGNGVVTSNTYYPLSLRLQKIATSKSSLIQSLGYTWDADGNVKSIADGVYLGAASASFGNIQYDDLNRLTSLTNAAGGFVYGYSSVGNILTNGESGVGSYVYGTIRPHCVRSANGMWFTYDQDGNVAFRNGQRLDYDANNHLDKVWSTNGILTTFGYAADGARLWEQTGTNALRVWIGNTYEEKNGLVLYHVYAGGRLVATFDKTGTNVFQYYHPDDLTSTSIQTDTNGDEIQNYGYSAFGQSRYTQSTNVFKVSRRYTSQILDEATGLYYYGARYYDPELGRFVQPDDIIPNLSNPQSYNRYSYVLNNPLRYTDPSGNNGEDIANWWTGVVGVAAQSYSAGPQHWIWNGTVGTANSLIGGVADPLRLGSSAGAVSGNLNATAGQIAIASVQEVSRAAAIVPVGAAIGKGASTLVSGLTGSAEREATGELVGLGAASRSEFTVRKTVSEMTATERRVHFTKMGVPEKEIGPSGYPKYHNPRHSSLKEAKDAARAEVGKGGTTVKHPSPIEGSGHFHGVSQQGEKSRIHHEYPE